MVSYKKSLGNMAFNVLNYTFLLLVALLCISPMLHILAVSFSSNVPVEANKVILWPIQFQLNTYKFVIGDSKFYTSFWVSVERTLLGLAVNMLLTVLAAYPLSKSRRVFPGREFYVWFFIVTMLFHGGLIPTYLLVESVGLIDTIWALILPGAVPVFNVILLQNFFKALPDEITEAAHIDGAGHWTILFRIMLPLSKPVIATLALFVTVTHWNAWFDGMIYMNRPEHYPLQTYLQTIVVQINMDAINDLELIKDICQENSKSAQIIIAMVPVLLVYPFLQRYFTKGIIMGSVKG